MSHNLSCKVSFIYTSWMAEMNGVAIIFCLEARVSATVTLVLCKRVMGMKPRTDQTVLGGILDFETEGN